jgi:hypothetical protein
MIDGGQEAEIEILAWSGAVANRRAGTMDVWKPLRAAFLGCLASALGLSAADGVQAKWNELPGLVQGRTVDALLADGTWITGQVLDVVSDALTMQVVKTPDPRTYPKGKVSIPKSSIRVVRVTSRRGYWRAVAALIGGGSGIVVASRVAEGGRESPSKTIAAYLTIVPVLSVAGYLVGRAADRRETKVITIEQ